MAHRTRAAIVSLGLVVAALSALGEALPEGVLKRTVPPQAIPLAVLGDSNSHSYQDRLAFPPGSADRGGLFRPRTYNWTEVLARLRPNEIDSGPWLAWGEAGVLGAAREALGLSAGRAPRKEDYLYNFANSGAGCSDLMIGHFMQAPRLVALMNREPDRWKRGVVVVRIGLNNWAPLLDLQARTPDAPQLSTATRACLDPIRAAIALIHATHPDTRILVVGIANEADGAALSARWVNVQQRANIETALAGFNGALRALAEATPHAAFFDDAEWFARHWGKRGSAREPAFKTVTIGKDFGVTNSNGDEPHNALLRDDHAGLVFNALWAQSLVERLRDAFGLPLTPVRDEEVARFVLPLAQPGK